MRIALNIIVVMCMWPLMLIAFVLDIRVAVTEHPQRLSLTAGIIVRDSAVKWFSKISSPHFLWGNGIVSRICLKFRGRAVNE